MREGITHIIGAGLAGLSAATALAGSGRRVCVYEAATHAGGRCRSYYDAAFDAVIDNGNHLLLSGNSAARAYLARIGAGDPFTGAEKPAFDFIDAHTLQRWTLRLNNGRLPLWLLNKNRRVAGTRAVDYLSILRLLNATPMQTVAQRVDPQALLTRRLWHPLLLSALNTHPDEASAQLAGMVLRGSVLKGGSACVPFVAERLSSVFIDPALRYLAQRQAGVAFNRRLRRIHVEGDRASMLEFTGGEPVALSAADAVICAIPPPAATALLPGIDAPDQHRAILNAHFRVASPPGFPAIMGVVNATVEWIFAFPDRISLTISDADRLMHSEREALARQLWREVAAITGLDTALPTWQIVKEKRATFAATPEQDAKRPGTLTRWHNVYLAGDWVQTGLPATIEGAVCSGEAAANRRMKSV